MRSRGIRKVFRTVAALVVLAVLALVVLICLDRKPGKALPKPEACPVVSNVIDAIVASFAPSSADVKWLDVRKMSVAKFAETISRWSPEATLWTPGEGDWLVVGVKAGPTNRLDAVIERFAEVATPFTLPEIYANYVGTLAEIRPAFATLNPEDGVVPELFVAKEVPSAGWLTDGELDADLAKRTRQEMRSMQVVRRVVLEGNMLSRQQKEDAAIAKWVNAYRLAPNDTLLLERMHHLRKNAEVFYRVGKYGMAAKCYETLLRVKRDDHVAMGNLGSCLKALGKREASEAAFRKSGELRQIQEMGKKAK